MQKKLIVANWKSNKNPQEAQVWLENFIQLTKNLSSDNFEVVICPPFVDLSVLAYKLQVTKSSYSISLGAQDVSPFEDGSYTGAVSASQMNGLIKYCLVGHSERRKNFGETTETVAAKIDQLLKFKIKPIICAQTPQDIPQNVKNYSPQDIAIMFEPAKAISSGGVYQAESSTVVKTTLETWQQLFGPYQFLYGGSVNPDNCKELISAGAQGFVIGHASLTPDTFYQILLNV